MVFCTMEDCVTTLLSLNSFAKELPSIWCILSINNKTISSPLFILLGALAVQAGMAGKAFRSADAVAVCLAQLELPPA